MTFLSLYAAPFEQNALPDNAELHMAVKIADINKKAVESLIKAGAFDCFDGNRAQFMSVFEGLIESAQSMAKKNIAGQMSLFGDFEESGDSFDSRKLPDLNPFSEELILSMEKVMLGIYISEHPLDSPDFPVRHCIRPVPPLRPERTFPIPAQTGSASSPCAPRRP